MDGVDRLAGSPAKNTALWRSVYLLFCISFLVVTAAAITLTPGSSFDKPPTIAKGDPVYVQGIATGHPQSGLQVWFIGKNLVRISSVSVEPDNSYEYELRSSDTVNLEAGQYFILIQHPMMNGQFDITYDAATGKVINQQLVGGTPIFQMTGGGGLQTPDAASALMSAINSQNIDDTFATASFVIAAPATIIDPIGEHYAGERFTIGGSTNLAVGDKLLVEITSSSFGPTQKGQSGEFSGASGTVTVEPGAGGMNRWSFDVDASSFRTDEYIVRVTGVTQDVSATALFNIVERAPVTSVPVPTPAKTTLPATTLPPATTPVPATTTTRAAGLAPALLGALVFIALVKRA